MTKPETTHFGFTDVPWEEKQSRVRDVFERVAGKYDIMNDAMSMGVHRLWKREFVAQLPLRPEIRMLDLAGGTGDIAFRMLERAENAKLPMQITLCDINAEMLKVGEARAQDKNWTGTSGDERLKFVCGNAEKLPFPDAHFDIVTIAFGIRNVTDIPAALREAHRVLKPGGIFTSLEFSNVEPAPLQKLYDLYSFTMIPRMGQLIAQDKDSYQYLVESIRKFPDRKRFAAMIAEAGFHRVSAQALSAGVVAIHRGWKV
jgi:demethylmenaquinone methyltransferase/2-methoxy-6-polyprenyl-1,4-benzoquinol methylase